MLALAGEYNLLTNNGKRDFGETQDEKMAHMKSQRIMSEYFIYADRIIEGIIQRYKFWQYEEVEDLFNVARMHILKSIQKEQYIEEKGNYFNFVSTVTSNNLRSHTLKKNRNRKFESNKFVSTSDEMFVEDKNGSEAPVIKEFNHDIETKLVAKEMFEELKKHFEGRGRFVELTEILENYYYKHIGEKFVKKRFIQVAQGHLFSQSHVNTYFNHVRRLPKVREILSGEKE